ncbi:MAG: phosphatidylglycerol lysyltransferase domain-containing protein [Acidobacteriota bacterium]
MTTGGNTALPAFQHGVGTIAQPLQPSAAAVPLPERAWIDHPSGYLATSWRNERFEVPGKPGFIAYRKQGKHLVAFGGVHAPASDRGRLLDSFLDAAEQRRKVALFIQVREEAVPLFLERGMTVNQCGTSISLDLAEYSFAGAEKTRLRRMISRARKAGIQALEIGVGVPSDAMVFAQLHAITRAWLANKRKVELDFMIGELGAPSDPSRRIFAGVDKAGRIVGFVTCVPAWGRMPGYLVDLSRCLPDAPSGTMETIIAEALGKLKREVAAFLHLGFAPFIFSGEEYPAANRTVAWLGRMLRRHGKAVYPAESQLAYKLKWRPEVIDREFIAARPLSLRAVFDLLRLTRSVWGR